jgi:hypothetical protein
VNWADPLEGALSEYSYSWPVPSVGRDAARMRESGCSFIDPHYSGAAALGSAWATGAVTTNAESNFTVTTSGSNVTISTSGSNVTALNTWDSSSVIGMAGYGLPAPEPLAVRRFYHWNKSVTAGAAGKLSGPQKVDVADTLPIAAVIAADAHETVQIMENEAIRVVEDEAVQAPGHASRRRLVRRTVPYHRSLTSVAVVLAGRKRSMVDEEWRGHLLGEHVSGLTQREQNRAARGFVLAAIRYRVQDAVDLAWRPADAILGSRLLSNLFVWGPVAVLLVVIYRHDGRYGLVADIQDPACLGAVLCGAIRTGRWWRGVKPPEPKARRTRN